MAPSTTRSPRAPGSVRPSPIACSECRKKHLKCDAVMPICGQCTDKRLCCNFEPSRRGFRGHARVQPSSTAMERSPGQQPTSMSGHPSPLDQAWSGTTTTASVLGTPWHSAASAGNASGNQSTEEQTLHFAATSTTQQSASGPTPPSMSSRSSLRSEEEHLINLYYSNFHQSHPILVPRYFLSQQNYPEYLRVVLQLIGSHYALNISSDSLRAAAHLAFCMITEKTLAAVQAMLLYAIVLHARYEPMEAMSAIARAADIAVELGMNQPDFATAVGDGDLVRTESARRTWWELYVTDGYLAALHRQTNFKCNAVDLKALVPCEDGSYADGNIPHGAFAVTQFDERHFSDIETNFPSACYRIDAIRILARVIAVSGANEAHPESIQAIDNAIASWKLHLPNDKAGIVDAVGEVDHMMFQAHIFIQCASIFLHFPRSELPITMPPAAEVTCAQKHMEQVSPTSTQHAVKAMTASKDLASLAALPVEKHSPFFICGLVFACIVQLSACSAYGRGTTQQNRDRVALIIGALKSMSCNWAIAQHVSQQLKKAAHEIFNPRIESEATSHSSHDSGIDLSAMSGDMAWLDLFYNEGMQNQLAIDGFESTGL